MGISRKSKAKRQLRLSRNASDHTLSGDSLPDHSLPQASHSVPDDHEIDEHPPTSSGLLEDPAAPKEIERNAIARIIEIQPLLSRFVDHLLTVQGGCRGQKPSKEAQWRVGRLLYEVSDLIIYTEISANYTLLTYRLPGSQPFSSPQNGIFI